MKEKVDCIMSGGIAVFYGKGDNFYFRINKKDKGFFIDLSCDWLSLSDIRSIGEHLLRLAHEIENRKKFTLGMRYYYVRTDGVVEDTLFENSLTDRAFILSGNAFLTKEEAEANKDKIIGKYQELLDNGIL